MHKPHFMHNIKIYAANWVNPHPLYTALCTWLVAIGKKTAKLLYNLRIASFAVFLPLATSHGQGARWRWRAWVPPAPRDLPPLSGFSAVHFDFFRFEFSDLIQR
jgi:hypothetical protein